MNSNTLNGVVAKAEDKNYRKLLIRLRTATPGKECRKLHKELKKYGDGLLFTDRYPNCSLYVSLAAFIISIVVVILRMIGVWN